MMYLKTMSMILVILFEGGIPSHAAAQGRRAKGSEAGKRNRKKALSNPFEREKTRPGRKTASVQKDKNNKKDTRAARPQEDGKEDGKATAGTKVKDTKSAVSAAGAGTTGDASAPASTRTRGSDTTPTTTPPAKSARLEGRPESTATAADEGPGDIDDLLEKSDEELLEQFEEDVEEEPKRKKRGGGGGGGGGGGRAQRFIQSLNPRLSAIAMFLFGYLYDTELKGKGNLVSRGGGLAKSGVALQEVEVAMQATVDPYFRLDIFIAFGEDEVGVEEAYFTTLSLPYQLQLRAGQMLYRFGRHNQSHLHNWDFVDNMVPVTRLLGEDGMAGVAAELSWMMPLPWYTNVMVAVSRPDQEGNASFVGDGDRKENFHFEDPRDLLYLGRLVQFWSLSDDWGLNFGLSYALGSNNSGAHQQNMTHLAGADVYLKWRPLRKPYLQMGLQAEGYYRYMQVPQNVLNDWGLYAQMIWRVEKRWWVAGRYDMVEIEDPQELLRWGFESLPDDPKYPHPIDDQHRGTVAVTYRPTEFSQIRLQYNYNHVRRTLPDGSAGDWKPVHEVVLQLMGNIGPHGAHPY